VNKSELVESIAEKSGLNKSQAGEALDALIDTVQSAVASGDKVTLPGFGAWSRTDRGVQGREVHGGCRLQVRREVGRDDSFVRLAIPNT
jgi:DNA-binding protein HU-beta